jgi:hypothetical protein
VKIFYLFGIIPGLIAVSMAQKSTFDGVIEYSQISGISLRTSRTVSFISGLIIGIIVGGLGLFILTIALTSPYKESRGAWPVGLFFVILGIATGAFISTRKATFWQIELKDKSGASSSQWQIPYRYGSHLIGAEFVKTVSDKAGIKVV